MVASFYVTGLGIVGAVLAGMGGGTGLNDDGVVQALYLMLMPSAMFACLMIAEFWVESLPTQVPKGSVLVLLEQVDTKAIEV